MHPHEHHVREAAYHIWESEGRPSGQEARHWEMACQLLMKSEASNEAIIGALESTPVKTRKKPAKLTVDTAPLEAGTAAKTKATKASLAQAKASDEKPAKATKSKKSATPVAASDTTAEPTTQMAAQIVSGEEKPKAKRTRKKAAESESV